MPAIPAEKGPPAAPPQELRSAAVSTPRLPDTQTHASELSDHVSGAFGAGGSDFPVPPRVPVADQHSGMPSVSVSPPPEPSPHPAADGGGAAASSLHPHMAVSPVSPGGEPGTLTLDPAQRTVPAQVPDASPPAPRPEPDASAAADHPAPPAHEPADQRRDPHVLIPAAASAVSVQVEERTTDAKLATAPGGDTGRDPVLHSAAQAAPPPAGVPGAGESQVEQTTVVSTQQDGATAGAADTAASGMQQGAGQQEGLVINNARRIDPSPAGDVPQVRAAVLGDDDTGRPAAATDHSAQYAEARGDSPAQGLERQGASDAEVRPAAVSEISGSTDAAKVVPGRQDRDPAAEAERRRQEIIAQTKENVSSITSAVHGGRHETLYYPASGPDIIRPLTAYDVDHLIAVDIDAERFARIAAQLDGMGIQYSDEVSDDRRTRVFTFEMGDRQRKITTVVADARRLSLSDFGLEQVDILHIYAPTGANRVYPGEEEEGLTPVESRLTPANYAMVAEGGFFVFGEGSLGQYYHIPPVLTEIAGLEEKEITRRHPSTVLSSHLFDDLVAEQKTGFIFQKVRIVDADVLLPVFNEAVYLNSWLHTAIDLFEKGTWDELHVTAENGMDIRAGIAQKYSEAQGYISATAQEFADAGVAPELVARFQEELLAEFRNNFAGLQQRFSQLIETNNRVADRYLAGEIGDDQVLEEMNVIIEDDYGRKIVKNKKWPLASEFILHKDEIAFRERVAIIKQFIAVDLDSLFAEVQGSQTAGRSGDEPQHDREQTEDVSGDAAVSRAASKGANPPRTPGGKETLQGDGGEERRPYKAVPIREMRIHFAAETRELKETGVPVVITVDNVPSAWVVPYEAPEQEASEDVLRYSTGELNHIASTILDKIVETGKAAEITVWKEPVYRIELTRKDAGGYEETTLTTIDALYRNTANTLGGIRDDLPVDIPYDDERVFRITRIEQSGDEDSEGVIRESMDQFKINISSHVRNARENGQRILLTRRREPAFWVIPIVTVYEGESVDYTVHSMAELNRYPQLVVGSVVDTGIPSLITRRNKPTVWMVPAEEGEVIPHGAVTRTLTQLAEETADVVNEAVGQDGITVYIPRDSRGRNRQLYVKIVPYRGETGWEGEQVVADLSGSDAEHSGTSHRVPSAPRARSATISAAAAGEAGDPMKGEVTLDRSTSENGRPHRITEYEELPWDGKIKNYTAIPDVPAGMTAEEAITRFQQEKFEELQEAIGIQDHGVPVEELRRASERYGLSMAPVVFVSFSDPDVQTYLLTHNEKGLAQELHENSLQTGFFHPRYGIGFVNTDYLLDVNDRIQLAAHESGGHGSGYSKYYYKRSPDGTLYFYDTNTGAKNWQITSRDPVFQRGIENSFIGFQSTLEEFIAEFRSNLIVESLGYVLSTSTVYVYFDESHHHGIKASERHRKLAPERTVAVSSITNSSNGWARDYAPLETAAQMLIARDPANPDAELFKAFFYGNGSIEAIDEIKRRVDAIDPKLTELLFAPLVSSNYGERSFNYNGKELALYMHQSPNFPSWTKEAVEQATAITRDLLRTVEVTDGAGDSPAASSGGEKRQATATSGGADEGQQDTFASAVASWPPLEEFDERREREVAESLKDHMSAEAIAVLIEFARHVRESIQNPPQGDQVPDLGIPEHANTSEIIQHLLDVAGPIEITDERHGTVHGTSLEVVLAIIKYGVIPGLSSTVSEALREEGEISVYPTPELYQSSSDVQDILSDYGGSIVTENPDRLIEMAADYAKGISQNHFILSMLGIPLSERVRFMKEVNALLFDDRGFPELQAFGIPREAIMGLREMATNREGFLITFSPRVLDEPGVSVDDGDADTAAIVIKTDGRRLGYHVITGIQPLGPKSAAMLRNLQAGNSR